MEDALAKKPHVPEEPVSLVANALKAFPETSHHTPGSENVNLPVGGNFSTSEIA